MCAVSSAYLCVSCNADCPNGVRPGDTCWAAALLSSRWTNNSAPAAGALALTSAKQSTYIVGCSFSGNSAAAESKKLTACGRDGQGGGGAVCAVLANYVHILNSTFVSQSATSGGKVSATN